MNSFLEIQPEIQKALSNDFSKKIIVFVRNIEEIQKLLKQIPENWDTDKERKYDVMFLQPEIDNPGILKELKPNEEIDEIFYHPGVVFWSIRTKDFGKSYISKIIGTKMYKSITIRTPNVVKKLYDLMKESS